MTNIKGYKEIYEMAVEKIRHDINTKFEYWTPAGTDETISKIFNFTVDFLDKSEGSYRLKLESILALTRIINDDVESERLKVNPKLFLLDTYMNIAREIPDKEITERYWWGGKFEKQGRKKVFVKPEPLIKNDTYEYK